MGSEAAQASLVAADLAAVLLGAASSRTGRSIQRRSAESAMMVAPPDALRVLASPASTAGVRVNSRPPVKPTTVEPFKHVIDEYKHQAQTITCTCGWHGSSATLDRGGSEWTAHLFEVRGKKR